MRIESVLYGHWETGTEGVLWAVWRKPDLPGSPYNNLFFLKEGDHLSVFLPGGELEWEGTIELDRNIGYHPYPMNPSAGQQVSLGHWVHGIQRGFPPDDWGRLFLGAGLRSPSTGEKLLPEPMRGVLTRKHNVWSTAEPVAMIQYRDSEDRCGEWAATFPSHRNGKEFVREDFLRWLPEVEILDVAVVPFADWKMKEGKGRL